MIELGTHTSASRHRLAFGWVGMAIVMSFVVAAIDFLELPSQMVYMSTVGVTLRKAIGLAVWASRR